MGSLKDILITLGLGEDSSPEAALTLVEQDLASDQARAELLAKKTLKNQELRILKVRLDANAKIAATLRNLMAEGVVEQFCASAEAAWTAQPSNPAEARNALRQAREAASTLSPDSPKWSRLNELEARLIPVSSPAAPPPAGAAAMLSAPANAPQPSPAPVPAGPPVGSNAPEIETLIAQAEACLDCEPPDLAGLARTLTVCRQVAQGLKLRPSLETRLNMVELKLAGLSQSAAEKSGAVAKPALEPMGQAPKPPQPAGQPGVPAATIQKSSAGTPAAKPGVPQKPVVRSGMDGTTSPVELPRQSAVRMIDSPSPVPQTLAASANLRPNPSAGSPVLSALPKPVSSPKQDAPLPARSRESSKWSQRFATAIALALVVGLGWAAWLWTQKPPDQPPKPIVSLEQSNVPPVVTPTAPAVTEVTLTAEPPTSGIRTNGVEISGAKFPVKLRGLIGSTISVEVFAPGYSNALRTLTLPATNGTTETFLLAAKRALLIVSSVPPPQTLTIREGTAPPRTVDFHPAGVLVASGVGLQVSVSAPNHASTSRTLSALKPEATGKLDLGTLQPDPARLMIGLNPPDAVVSVQYPGRPPISFGSTNLLHGIESGTPFELRVEHPDYVGQTNKFAALSAGQSASVGQYNLVLKPAALLLSVQPPDLTVQISTNGTALSLKPSGEALHGLPPRVPMNLHLSKEGYVSADFTITLQPGETRRITNVLAGRPATAFVTAETRPFDLLVQWGDSSQASYSQIGAAKLLTNLPSRIPITLVASAEGHYAVTNTRTFAPGEDASIPFGSLKAAVADLAIRCRPENIQVSYALGDGDFQPARLTNLLASLPVGRPIRVKVERFGRISMTKEHTLSSATSGRPEELDFGELPRRLVSRQIISTPAGAESVAWMGDMEVSRTTGGGTLGGLPLGEKIRIETRLQGYLTATNEFTADMSMAALSIRLAVDAITQKAKRDAELKAEAEQKEKVEMEKRAAAANKARQEADKKARLEADRKAADDLRAKAAEAKKTAEATEKQKAKARNLVLPPP